MRKNAVEIEGLGALYPLAAACKRLHITYDCGRMRLANGCPHVVIGGRYFVSLPDLKRGERTRAHQKE